MLKSKTSDYDYYFNPQKKKKQSSEQCKLDQNVQTKKLVLVYEWNPGLFREAKRSIKDQNAKRDINHLIEHLFLGNKNPGKNTIVVLYKTTIIVFKIIKIEDENMRKNY